MEIKFVIIGWSITILLLIVTIVVGIMLIAKLRKQNAMLKDDVIAMEAEIELTDKIIDYLNDAPVLQHREAEELRELVEEYKSFGNYEIVKGGGVKKKIKFDPPELGIVGENAKEFIDDYEMQVIKSRLKTANDLPRQKDDRCNGNYPNPAYDE